MMQLDIPTCYVIDPISLLRKQSRRVKTESALADKQLHNREYRRLCSWEGVGRLGDIYALHEGCISGTPT